MDKCERQEAVQFRVWSEEEFASSSTQWQQLLEKSDADPLFNSWDWQWLWWKHNSTALNARLLLVAAYAGSELVGLAPFFLHDVRHKFVKATRLELLGCAWRNRSVFSEYLDLIIARDRIEQVLSGFAECLWDQAGWSDLVMSNVRTESVAASLAANLRVRGAYLRSVDHLEAHAVKLPSSFEQYVQKLGSGTRRRLWRNRSKLKNPVLKTIRAHEVNGFLNTVDDFHQVRWGRRQYTGFTGDFHRELATRLAVNGHLQMTLLHTDNGLLSALYNVRMRSTEYNIQSGFDSRIPGLSPGYLHFGYSIENACADGVQSFDLLAGKGQHRQYKADLVTDSFGLMTLQVIRARFLRRLYQWHDTARGYNR